MSYFGKMCRFPTVENLLLFEPALARLAVNTTVDVVMDLLKINCLLILLLPRRLLSLLPPEVKELLLCGLNACPLKCDR